ncbi:non-homologous end-joining DNA ligase [Vallicoccus soli]|uniref:ATP-dependent DNA ligase n=1 Tax=Vallicoccus soli TaxID=2339232 RepID=A0A3A3YRL4_9ACTN|nr:non-homologous end-joining DNA ligase [Vallicoccus soli]RJK92924.1 ATP-dependent DNA ligase [Vallicoccus soli]
MATPFVEIEVGDRDVRVSNPDKTYFPGPGITKREVVEYYLAVGDGILRALRERPVTMERWPGGVHEGMKLATRMDNRGDAFYQKRVPKNAPPWVETAHITFPSGRTADEVCPTELATVAWCANLGTITFHPWPVRRADVDHPDELRIDLDPQPGTAFAEAVEVAGVAREVLAELGWRGYPKTSGNRGVHVYVRIAPRWSFTEVRHAAIAFGRELERRMPGRVTTKWWKEERGEAIFVDYNQNARDRTIASAYSIRPLPHAPVSTPLTWDELPLADPRDLTVRTLPARFAAVGDLMAGIDDVEHDLTPLLEWYERDERDRGLGDMPYPPDYPKMPGEPKRVQPSRARAEPAPEPADAPD